MQSLKRFGRYIVIQCTHCQVNFEVIENKVSENTDPLQTLIAVEYLYGILQTLVVYEYSYWLLLQTVAEDSYWVLQTLTVAEILIKYILLLNGESGKGEICQLQQKINRSQFMEITLSGHAKLPSFPKNCSCFSWCMTCRQRV